MSHPEVPATTRLSVTNRRVVAAVIDVIALPALIDALLAASLGSLPLRGGGLVIAALFLVIAEATVGQTPGKALLRIATVSISPDPFSLQQAVVRRAWMPAMGLTAAIDPTGLIPVAIVISLMWTTYRSPDARGWHDRVAGTRVEGAEHHRPALAWSGVVVGVVGLALTVMHVIRVIVEVMDLVG